MKKIFPILTWSLMLFLISGCLVMDNKYDSIAPGSWRAELELVPRKIVPRDSDKDRDEDIIRNVEEISEEVLPFVFEVIYKNDKDVIIEILNGDERIRMEDITIGRDRATGKDTLMVHFPVYESYIKAVFEEGIMNGEFVATNRKNYSIPFRARQGKNHRFTMSSKPPSMDVSGRWEATFGLDSDDPYQAIGEFTQQGNRLLGTFVTETGDYRFLEGTVQEDKLYLSCFDGAHAFLFSGKILADSSIVGTFRSGSHFKTTWKAVKNEKFKLRNPLHITKLKDGYNEFAFEFSNPQGKIISLEDDAYKNKVKLVQIMGTWCPNCRDETLFLNDYLTNNPHPDLAVVSLAFERHKEKKKVFKTINTFKDKFDIDYEIVHAGHSDKTAASEALPMLNEVISYPTLLFIDRENRVRKIHTGFSGPATTEYKTFVEEFDQIVNDLIAEK